MPKHSPFIPTDPPLILLRDFHYSHFSDDVQVLYLSGFGRIFEDFWETPKLRQLPPAVRILTPKLRK